MPSESNMSLLWGDNDGADETSAKEGTSTQSKGEKEKQKTSNVISSNRKSTVDSECNTEVKPKGVLSKGIFE